MKKDNGKNKPKKKETLYNKVYNDLIAKIQSGKLKVGDKLPTELELTEIYGVSRITVAHALKNLSDANLIYRVKRSGTFVNGKLNRNAPLIVPVVLPFVEDLNEIMMGIQNTALTFNTFTPFYNSKNNLERERKILTEVLSLKPDGIIVYPCNSMKNIDLYAELLAQNIPIVCIDRPIDGLETPLVTTKNADCMCRIIDRLAALGHKRIGFCSISDKMSFPEAERFKGFCRGIVKNKLSLKNEFIFHTYDLHKKEIAATLDQQQQLFQRYIKNEMHRYLSLEEKPTAICCINDSTLEMLYRVSEQLGIRIPEDLTITGFDCADVEKAKRMGYLCIRQDFASLCSAAIKLMLEILDGHSHRNLTLIDGILIG